MEYTRLDKQIADKQAELYQMINASERFKAKFESHIPKLMPILKKYGVKEIDVTNTYFEYTPLDNKPILRIFLKVDLVNVSFQRRKNLEKLLRKAGIPMPLCPMSKQSINLVYHD